MRAVWRCIRHSNGALEQVGGRHTPFACAPRDLLTYAWSRPRHSMPRAPCPRRATPSDQPSARAPSQRAYLAFSPDPPTNDRAGALPTTEPVSCRPTRVPHAHSPCAAHPEPARRQRRATCAHPWTVLTRPCDAVTVAQVERVGCDCRVCLWVDVSFTFIMLMDGCARDRLRSFSARAVGCPRVQIVCRL